MELWTAPTPNEVTIMVEELIEAGIDIGEVDVRQINLMQGEQFEADFVERNPNQKIPTLRHNGQDIFESCAILQYLGERLPRRCCRSIASGRSCRGVLAGGKRRPRVR